MDTFLSPEYLSVSSLALLLVLVFPAPINAPALPLLWEPPRCRCLLRNLSRKLFKRPTSFSLTGVKLSEYRRERRLGFLPRSADRTRRLDAAGVNLLLRGVLFRSCARSFEKFLPLPGPIVELRFLIGGWFLGSFDAAVSR